MSKVVQNAALKGLALVATCTLGACDSIKQDKHVLETKSAVAQEVASDSVDNKTVTKQEDSMSNNNVEKLASGLVIETLKEAGQGAVAPAVGKRVTVHYTGWLDENGQRGQKFDSSLDRGEPFSFILGVGQVIRGWDEGVAKMKVGQKALLTIPASIGYGSRGAGRVIPPNATLLFEVEVLSAA